MVQLAEAAPEPDRCRIAMPPEPPRKPLSGRTVLGLYALACFVLYKAFACVCGGVSLPSYDPRFERLARNVGGLATSTLGNGPPREFLDIDGLQERLRTDDAFRKGDYFFDVGDERMEAVCDILVRRAKLQDGVFAIWNECFVPPSDGTWQVRFVRFAGVETIELGRIEIGKRLCAGKTKIEVAAELRSIESFWTYGETNADRCHPSSERRRTSASRGMPGLIRVDPRAAEVEVVPLSCLLDLEDDWSLDRLFRDEALQRFYLDIHRHRSFSPVPIVQIPPIVLSLDATSIEAVLER